MPAGPSGATRSDRRAWPSSCRHHLLSGSAEALRAVAARAGEDDVVLGRLAAARLRNDVVEVEASEVDPRRRHPVDAPLGAAVDAARVPSAGARGASGPRDVSADV